MSQDSNGHFMRDFDSQINKELNYSNYLDSPTKCMMKEHNDNNDSILIISGNMNQIESMDTEVQIYDNNYTSNAIDEPFPIRVEDKVINCSTKKRRVEPCTDNLEPNVDGSAITGLSPYMNNLSMSDTAPDYLLFEIFL